MSSPLTREELEAHVNGLRELITSRFDGVDDNFTRLNGRVNRTEERVTKNEQDIARIKAYWAAGVVVLGTAWQVLGNYLKGLLP